MAGLSMGGAQTFSRVLGNLNKFAYLQVVSAAAAAASDEAERKFKSERRSCNGGFAEPAAFNGNLEELLPRHRLR